MARRRLGLRGEEFEGEMHGAALVGEDGGVVETGLDFHSVCVRRSGGGAC